MIAGGGRCNVLPIAVDETDFHTTGSRHVVRRILRTWPLAAQRAFFEEKLQLPLMDEEDSGKVFPVCESGRKVRDRFVEAVQEEGAEVRCGWRVERVRPSTGGGFVLESADGETLRTQRLIMAAGGQAAPATGSDGHGYRLVRSLGHRVVEPVPALVPLLSPDKDLQALAGVSLPVRWRARVQGKLVEERVRELLFTHRGFSGPAPLDFSWRVVREQATIQVSWEDGNLEEWEAHFIARARREVGNAVAEYLPRRLSEVLLARVGIRQKMRCGNLSRGQRQRLLALLCDFPLILTGNEGFAKAEVTSGGVPLGELNPSTLESRRTPGLFLCGEILDATGRLGGFNFLWAWITGRLAGERASKS